MPKVAVVGAGLSGLMCARTLADHGVPVTVFEKSRGVGGRMATRRADEGLRFDHGAQYFTVRDHRFRRYVQSWMADGIVKPWNARIVVLQDAAIQEDKSDTERFVATPDMNAICKHLAADLEVRCQTRVAPLQRRDDLWHVASEEGGELGSFDIVVLSAPAAQTAHLLRSASGLAARIREVVMHKCWALMLAFPQSLNVGFDGAFVHDSPLSWIACNSSKPGRDQAAEAWVAHASSEWSRSHLEESAETVEEVLTREFYRVVGLPSRIPEYRTAHRWRFALPEPLAVKCLFDAERQAVACGDWCGGPRVEGAFLSGMAAAGRILGILPAERSSEFSETEQRTLF